MKFIYYVIDMPITFIIILVYKFCDKIDNKFNIFLIKMFIIEKKKKKKEK